MSKRNKEKRPYFRYYPEEVLIDLVQRGVFSWVDYVEHYSYAWRCEYNEFCNRMGMPRNDHSALGYIVYKEDLAEEAMQKGYM